jgi:hypothetical protein
MALNVGEKHGGGAFKLPKDLVARTLAIIGQRGAGKTSLATVIAEEMCKNALPWIALDPVGVWWGLRSAADGSPGGHPVVVFGGDRGDLPLEKGFGQKIAEACVAANVFAVLDLSGQSKTTWRFFVRDFCRTLRSLKPPDVRMIFLEEAAEFVPQKPSHELGKECAEAVESLIRLGRNWGFGGTVLGQRPAKIDKDVLSQCENLLIMRTSGAHDRKALKEWIEANATDAKLEKVLGELATLPDGAAWWWSPQWQKEFVRIQARRRETFHPGETRTVGGKTRSVDLIPVDEFVSRVRKELTKVQAVVALHADQVPKSKKGQEAFDSLIGTAKNMVANDAEVEKLSVDIQGVRAAYLEVKGRVDAADLRAADAERRLEAVRKHLRPTYEMYRTLFEDMGEKSSNGSIDRTIYEPWLDRAGKRGCRRMLEILIDRPELTKPQLGTLAQVSHKSSTFRAYMSWLKKNSLIETEGDNVKLLRVS